MRRLSSSAPPGRSFPEAVRVTAAGMPRSRAGLSRSVPPRARHVPHALAGPFVGRGFRSPYTTRHPGIRGLVRHTHGRRRGATGAGARRGPAVATPGTFHIERARGTARNASTSRGGALRGEAPVTPPPPSSACATGWSGRSRGSWPPGCDCRPWPSGRHGCTPSPPVRGSSRWARC